MSIDGLLEALTQVRKWLLRSGVLYLLTRGSPAKSGAAVLLALSLAGKHPPRKISHHPNAHPNPFVFKQISAKKHKSLANSSIRPSEILTLIACPMVFS